MKNCHSDDLATEGCSAEISRFPIALGNAICAVKGMTITKFAEQMLIGRESLRRVLRGMQHLKKANARKATAIAIANLNGEILKKRSEIERLRMIGNRLKEEYHREYD